MKKIFLSFILIFLFLVAGFSFVQAQFDTATGVPVNLVADYPEFVSTPSIAGMISKIYTYALSIAGILAIVMIVYGGISYALQPGNSAKQSDAKDIMQSAVWGIVLLAGAYVILRAINPDLVILRDPGFTKITDLETLNLGEIENDTGTVEGGTSIGCTIKNTNIENNAKKAQDIINLGTNLSTSGSCNVNGKTGTDPRSIISSVANKNVPMVCNWAAQTKSCSVCQLGGPGGETTVCPTTLDGLIGTQTEVKNNTSPAFTVTSITGGLHGERSDHYKGMAIDVVPNNRSDENWKKLGATLKKYGGNPYCEAVGVWEKAENCPANFGSKENAHLHVYFSGAGTMGEQELSNIKKAAEDYLKLQPDLLSGFSWGVPAISSTQTCSAYAASPKDNVVNVAEGQKPFVCDGSKIDLNSAPEISQCGCNQGGQNGNVTIHEDVFKILTALEKGKTDGNKIPAFRVVAITGGIQIGETVNEKEVASRHYSGVSFDVVPTSGKKADFEMIKNFIKKQGYAVYYEALTTGTFTSKFSEDFFSDFDDLPSGCTSSIKGDSLDSYRAKGGGKTCSLLRLHIIAHQG
jgi:uncharacterized protein (DUF736 family)